MKPSKSFRSSIRVVFGIFVLFLCLSAFPRPAAAASFKNSKPVLLKNYSAYSNGRIVLRWKKIAGAKKYEVWRSAKKNGAYKKYAVVKTNQLSKKTVGTYYYKVRAINGKTKSKFSTPRRYFAANGIITHKGFNGTDGLWLRVKVTNKTSKPMIFLGATNSFPTIYLVRKSTKSVVAKTNGYLSTSNDPYGISIGGAKQIAKWKTASLYFRTMDYVLWRTYAAAPSAYEFLISMPFYDGPNSSTVWALACTEKAAGSAVAGK